jgi:hypothetical protein
LLSNSLFEKLNTVNQLSCLELPSAGVLSPNSYVGIDQTPGNRQLFNMPGNARDDNPDANAGWGQSWFSGPNSGTNPERLYRNVSTGFNYSNNNSSSLASVSCGADKIPGRRGRAPHSPSFPYKELLVVSATPEAKSSVKTSNSESIVKQDFSATCAGVVIGECKQCGARAIKVIYCGKEWCSHCGQEGSPTHNDRYAKYLSRARQMQTMGYFVVEWPIKYRHVKNRVYSKTGLRHTTNKVVEILAGKRGYKRNVEGKREHGRVNGYFSRGMIRWHFFGDKQIGKYNPHMNILVDAGFIEPDKLEEIKAALRSGLNCPDLIVNYSFRSTPAEMAHTCRYVTRPTFHNYDWDSYIAKELFELRNENDTVIPFRNSRTWGDWKQPKIWNTSETAVYEKIDKLRNRNECGKCGGHMNWTDMLPIGYLKELYKMGLVRPVVRGYYEFLENVPKYNGSDTEWAKDYVDTTTGEIKPIDYKLKRELNGHNEWFNLYLACFMRRVKWLKELRDMEIAR